ncbi:hypothetical protein JAU75_21740 [Ochrobactrum sp. Q0168]|uniref:hypothetical protein n=1 Tax=Ochrobactrum sp. Q0168 TaxID=2793241 RepID=UPI0018EA7AA4|nr:hypothetical protein [Ochrobactrum sp. Q0168]
MSVCPAKTGQITQLPKTDLPLARPDPELVVDPPRLLPAAIMTPVDLLDFTIWVVTFPFVGTAANAVPAVMNAPTANKTMVFIISSFAGFTS